MADQSEELDAARIREVATGGDGIRVQRRRVLADALAPIDRVDPADDQR